MTLQEQIESFFKSQSDLNSEIATIEFLGHEAAFKLLRTKALRVRYLNRFPRFKMVVINTRERYIFHSTVEKIKENKTKNKNNILFIGDYHLDNILDMFIEEGIVLKS